MLHKHEKFGKAARCVFQKLIQKRVPTETTHRQSFLPWMTTETSHMMKKSEQNGLSLMSKPTNYTISKVMQAENTATRCSKQDKYDDQKKMLGSPKQALHSNTSKSSINATIFLQLCLSRAQQSPHL